MQPVFKSKTQAMKKLQFHLYGEGVLRVKGLALRGERGKCGRKKNTVKAIRNLLPRKFDPLETFNEDHVLGKVNFAWVRRCRDTKPCDTQESIEHMSGLTFSVCSERFCLYFGISTGFHYTVGVASLAHLYKSLCCASQYDCKEIDGPLILLFVWAWERMPFLAPIPRDQFVDVGVPLARRRGLDDMGVDDFIWRPYIGVGVPEYLAVNLFMCSTKSPLVSFELQQLPPDSAFEIGRDHCRQLTGPQNYDWRDRNIQWVNLWISGCYNTLQLGDEIVDFHPLSVYYDWYTQQYGHHLRLSGEDADTNTGTIGRTSWTSAVLAYEHHFEALAYKHQFQMPGYHRLSRTKFHSNTKLTIFRRNIAFTYNTRTIDMHGFDPEYA
ncbi:hypothetical protein Ahy_B08g093384 [Arachis hypogaea]|uniref:Aminotransferase-like plant mobile domain-containing protein n=1 Tax=Arachis hypogaea TaxID=3818 RepID=A0A444Y5V3_ARAHY|nr:hypothetical protein Ahy_B08g093384 [Arachis hypogaea]